MTELHYVDDGAGWRLALRRTKPDDAREPRGCPVLVVPGYQMNSSIFGFHPSGPSLEAFLAARGLDVWCVDLRGQGRAARTWGDDRFGLDELAVEDLGAAIAYVRGVTRKDLVDVIGCSLGTSLTFAHVACVSSAPVRGVVAMGGVVTWDHVHRAARLAAHAPWLVGQLRMRGTRELARRALPVVTRVAPRLLGVYLNVKSTDTSQVDAMVETVEDPNPIMNRQIAAWIARRELVVRGVNVSRALGGIDRPFLCVLGRQDGIVPPATARALFEQIGSRDKTLIEVGDRETPIGHADLFLAHCAQQRIFAPIADWLLARA
jgi:pimeloyl-ACP methyl ester carboxylesterase